MHQLLSYDVRRNPSLGMPNTVPGADHEIEEPCPCRKKILETARDFAVTPWE